MTSRVALPVLVAVGLIVLVVSGGASRQQPQGSELSEPAAAQGAPSAAAHAGGLGSVSAGDAIPAGCPAYQADFSFNEVPSPLAEQNPLFPLVPRPMPAVGECFADARFGTVLRRVTQTTGTVARHEYSRFDPYNTDHTLVILLAPGGGFEVFRTTGSLPYNQPTGLAATLTFAEPRWDETNANLIWGLEDFAIVTFNVATQEKTTVKDFATDARMQPLIAAGNVYRITMKDEGEASLDFRYWALMLQGNEQVEYRPMYLFTWDRQTNTVLGVYPEGHPLDAATESEIDWVGMSPQGNWVLIGGMHTNTGNLAGLTMAARDFSLFHRLDYTTSHSDVGLDTAGREVVVMQNSRTDFVDLIPIALTTQPILDSGGDYTGSGHVKLIRLFYDASSPNGLNSGVHISCNTPGYCFISTTIAPNTPERNWLDRSLVLARLDQTRPRIFYLAKLHNTTSEEPRVYWDETHGTITRDGSLLVWADNWGQNVGQERIFMMQLFMPANWGELTGSTEAPVVSQHPSNQTVSAGTTTTFTSTASGATSVRWQISTNSGASWASLADAAPYSGVSNTTLTITGTPVGLSGAQYRAEFTNSLGMITSNSATLTVSHVVTTPPSLRFAATKAGSAATIVNVTPPQAVTVDVTGAPTGWSAAADQPWVQVTNGTGSGDGQFTVAIVDTGNVLGGSTNATASVTITPTVAGLSAISVPVRLSVELSGGAATAAPFGQVDTPVQNATGVQGAIGVSGWALDDLAVTGVKIYRDCQPFDNQAGCFTLHGFSMVFIGDAAFVAGARPDVEAAFPTAPQAYRGGWGYLMLTNMLPHVTGSLAYGGQGTLTLYAIATDVEGKTTLLGRTQADATPTTITMSNDTIAKPFGAIDTPSQGQTVSGLLANFGWVLTPDSDTVAGAGDILVPTDGSTMNVVVDGVAIGKVAYNQCRGNVGNPVPPGSYCDDDVANIFGNTVPLAAVADRTGNPTRHRNLDADRAAIGSFAINTTLMTNGLHNIAWGVTDSAGRAEGIGSRNFIVLNTGSDPGGGPVGDAAAGVMAGLKPRTTSNSSPSTVVQGFSPAVDGFSPAVDGFSPAVGGALPARTGFDFEAPLETLPADGDGVHRVQLTELGRLEVHVGAVTAGYLVANGTLRALPVGSHLDRQAGVFTWMPSVGYFGTYRLAFVRAAEQVLVEVTVRPDRVPDPGEGQIRMHLDLPSAGQAVGAAFIVAGWALDPQAPFGSGIGAVHVWAQRRDVPTASAAFLGEATLGGVRPDVAQAFGPQFQAAGFGLTTTALPAGVYDITAYVWNRRTARFEDARTVTVTVR